MKNKLSRLAQILLLGVFIWSSLQILDYFHQRNKSNEGYHQIKEDIGQALIDSSKEESDKSVAPSLSDATESPGGEEVDYQDLFRQLREINSDVIAYLIVPGTPISYPVVQTSNNEYYLDRDLHGQKNIQGVPYLEYQNASDFSDQNSVIYGHLMLYYGSDMFTELQYFLEQDYTNQSTKRAYIYQEDQVLEYELFSAFRVGAYEDYRIPNQGEEDYLQFLKNLKARSATDFGRTIDFQSDDRILTLSTCTPENDPRERIAVFGLLVQSD